MQHAQFRMIPPLAKITELFESVTSKPFTSGISWTEWKLPATSAPYEVFRPYIRPSHHTLLNSVIAGSHPTAFLRQLLRPHGYKIQSTETGWTLQNMNPEPVAIRIIKQPVTLYWD
jgi:hypothetical protein